MSLRNALAVAPWEYWFLLLQPDRRYEPLPAKCQPRAIVLGCCLTHLYSQTSSLKKIAHLFTSRYTALYPATFRIASTLLTAEPTMQIILLDPMQTPFLPEGKTLYDKLRKHHLQNNKVMSAESRTLRDRNSSWSTLTY